jgi:hypothetical protein
MDRRNRSHMQLTGWRGGEYVVQGDCCWVSMSSRCHHRVVVFVLSDSGLGAVNRNDESTGGRVNRLLTAICIFALRIDTNRRSGTFRRISCVFAYLLPIVSQTIDTML